MKSIMVEMTRSQLKRYQALLGIVGRDHVATSMDGMHTRVLTIPTGWKVVTHGYTKKGDKNWYRRSTEKRGCFETINAGGVGVFPVSSYYCLIRREGV
jgi:hypothetical protein